MGTFYEGCKSLITKGKVFCINLDLCTCTTKTYVASLERNTAYLRDFDASCRF